MKKDPPILPFIAMEMINNLNIYPTIGYTSPIYIPKKHTVKSYRTQQRESRK